MIISLAIALLVIFIFRKRVVEEIQLLRQVEANHLIEEQITSFFYPLSGEEKINVRGDCIEKLIEIQERLSQTFFAKYFIDYSEKILDYQKSLTEVKKDLESIGECISFSTLNLSSITTSLPLDRDNLLKLACLIDETFDSQEINYVIFLEDDTLCLNMLPHEDFDPEDSRLEEFHEQVEKIFEAPVILDISCLDTLDEELESKFKVREPTLQ